MPGPRPKVSGRSLTALLTAGSLAVLGSLLFTAGPAGAADTVKAQLSLTGIATSDNPTGGSTLGVHPGDTVSISPAAVPTAGFAKLGLDGLLSNVTGLLASYQVKVDFSHLPGGKKDTVLDGKDVKSFTFPTVGTYDFTWSAESVGLLGGIVPINLDGNQLKDAGVKLNAKNQYVGQIVVAKNPPKGGIGLQLPGVSVQPTLPIVGTLPKIGLPGVTTPTIPVTLPDLNPTKSAAPTKSSGPRTTAPAVPTTGALPVPAMVVPQGTSGGSISDGGGYSVNSLGSGGSAALPGITSNGSSGTAAKPGAQQGATVNSTGKNKTVDLASDRRVSASGLPVVLAIVAMLALVLVAGTYARLFLLRKS